MVLRITQVCGNCVGIFRTILLEDAFFDAGCVCISRSAEHNVNLRILLFCIQTGQSFA